MVGFCKCKFCIVVCCCSCYEIHCERIMFAWMNEFLRVNVCHAYIKQFSIHRFMCVRFGLNIASHCTRARQVLPFFLSFVYLLALHFSSMPKLKIDFTDRLDFDTILRAVCILRIKITIEYRESTHIDTPNLFTSHIDQE